MNRKGYMQKHIVSFSGGKDSTALLLMLLEKDYPIEDIVFFDTGWEFPEIIDHVHKVEKYINREITILYPKKSFHYWMMERDVKTRDGSKRIGFSWPSSMRRWCTRLKIDTINTYIGKNTIQYIGISANETKRIKPKRNVLYPLVDWNMSESDCLQYCYDRGFDWKGLYKHFNRVSCFCCPLQRIGELRTLRKIKPDLWRKMLDWEIEMEKTNSNRGFRGYKTVHDLENRFNNEDIQLNLF